VKIDEEKLQAERVKDLQALGRKIQDMAQKICELKIENRRLKLQLSSTKNVSKHKQN